MRPRLFLRQLLSARVLVWVFAVTTLWLGADRLGFGQPRVERCRDEIMQMYPAVYYAAMYDYVVRLAEHATPATEGYTALLEDCVVNPTGP